MARSNTKNRKLVKNLGGRPTKVTEEGVKKLESIFKIGGNVEEACSYAGISKQTYYTHLKTNEGFLTRMEAARHYADIAAKNVVVKAIVDDKDLATAKWWLEKREFREGPLAALQINFNKVLTNDREKYQL